MDFIIDILQTPPFDAYGVVGPKKDVAMGAGAAAVLACTLAMWREVVVQHRAFAPGVLSAVGCATLVGYSSMTMAFHLRSIVLRRRKRHDSLQRRLSLADVMFRVNRVNNADASTPGAADPSSVYHNAVVEQVVRQTYTPQTYTPQAGDECTVAEGAVCAVCLERLDECVSLSLWLDDGRVRASIRPASIYRCVAGCSSSSGVHAACMHKSVANHIFKCPCCQRVVL